MFPNVRFLIVVFLTSVVLSPLAFGMVAAYLVTREPLTRPIPGVPLSAVAHVAPGQRMTDAVGVGFGARATLEPPATARANAPEPPQSPPPGDDHAAQRSDAIEVTASVPAMRDAPKDEIAARPEIEATAPPVRDEPKQEVAARADAPAPEPIAEPEAMPKAADTDAAPTPVAADATVAPPEPAAAPAPQPAAQDVPLPTERAEQAVAAIQPDVPVAPAVADEQSNALPTADSAPVTAAPHQTGPPAEAIAAPAAEPATARAEAAATSEAPKRSDGGETTAAPARAADAAPAFTIASRFSPDPPQPTGLPAAPSADEVLASDVPLITGAVPMPRPRATKPPPRTTFKRRPIRKPRPAPQPQPTNPFAAIFGPPPAQ
jgi:hypothetical protein